jgi:flagellar protein FlgJ
MFTGLLDQRLAAQTPARWEHGLAEALYRQLRGAAGVAEPSPSASDAASAAIADSSSGDHAPILGSR